MGPLCFLRCLGHPVLLAPTGEPIKFRTRKHLALLVYLAVEGRRIYRRDHLAELLWPRVSIGEARHSLATALSILRPRLGPGALESSRDTIVLTGGRIVLDLDRLTTGDILGNEVTGTLEVAAFLDGFDIADAGEFSRWKDRQQARLMPAIKDALLVLIDRCRRTGDSRQIEQLADRMLSFDDLSEEAIRAKMEARAFAGDRLAALRIFEAWKKKLALEVAAAPSELLEGMAVRLRRRGWERTTLSDIPAATTDQWCGRPFVGRSAEYRTLYEAWEGLRKGVAGHALVLGDSGIGKTTLVQRFTTASGLEGAAISRVQSYDLEREIPYATLNNLVHGLLDRPGVTATNPEALSELSRTVPEVRRRFPTIPASVDTQGENARIRLTEAFQQLLIAVAEEQPVILVLDDAHLADDASLAVVHLAIRRTQEHPIMVLLIARPGELTPSSRTARLRDLAAVKGMRTIELGPLSDEESRLLLESLVSARLPQPGSTVRRTLLRASGGFPMVMELLVQDWHARGDRSLAFALDAMTLEIGAPGTVPLVYRQALERISQTLDPIGSSVLNMAAILGPRLNELGLYAFVDLSVGQTMAGMVELSNRRVLRDGGKGLEFVNEMMRGAAYLSVPSPLRKQLHGDIANEFIANRLTGGPAMGLEIAWHCVRAGRSDEATPYLLQGAREARAQGALHEAERGLSTALCHLGPPQRTHAALLLAEVLQEEGEWAQSLEVLERELGSEEWDKSHLPRVLAMMAKFNLFGADPSSTYYDLDYLLNVIVSRDDVPVRTTAARIATYFAGSLRDSEAVKRVLEAVSQISSDSLSTDDIARVALNKAILLFQLQDRTSSLIEIQAAARHIDGTHTASAVACELQAGLGAIMSMEGNYDSALQHLETAHRIATRLDNATLKRSVAANLALCLARSGRYEEQLRWARDSQRLCPETLTTYSQILSTYCASLALVLMGRTAEALRELSDITRRLPGTLPAWALQAWNLYSADVLHLAGETKSAQRAALLGTTGENSVLHCRNFAGPFCRWTARLAASPQEYARANETIAGFQADLASYDAMDRAEILSGAVMLDHQQRETTTIESLRLALNELPPAAAQYVSSLSDLPKPFNLDPFVQWQHQSSENTR